MHTTCIPRGGVQHERRQREEKRPLPQPFADGHVPDQSHLARHRPHNQLHPTAKNRKTTQKDGFQLNAGRGGDKDGGEKGGRTKISTRVVRQLATQLRLPEKKKMPRENQDEEREADGDMAPHAVRRFRSASASTGASTGNSAEGRPATSAITHGAQQRKAAKSPNSGAPKLTRG